MASTSEVFTDDSRSTPANGGIPAIDHRTLPTLIFYPAVTTGRHSSFPLIVFSHGFGSTAAATSSTLRALAAGGYVVAAPDFPLSTIGAPGGLDLSDFSNQPGDVSFVITQMLNLDENRGSPVYHEINDHEIGVAGHSLGAVTTLGVAYNSCCRDSRIDAAVELDGEEELPANLGQFHGSYFTGHDPPLLIVHGTADTTAPYSYGQAIYNQAPAPKYFLTLQGAPHTGFASAPWAAPTNQTMLAFFDHYLKAGHSVAQIQHAGTNPGTTTIQSTTK